MRIIPAIDIIDGKCVRLSMGKYNTAKLYNDNPLDVALLYEDHGIEYLHLVDLDGARGKGIVNHNILERISTRTNLKVDFGGGIKSAKDLRIAFDCGARQVTVGSLAVHAPLIFIEWVQQYGSERIILGADIKENTIATDGWLNASDQMILPFLQKYFDQGVCEVICTDVSKDGMLTGPAIELYREIRSNLPDLRLIASGGISKIEELPQLEKIGCAGVIIGKALYEDRITLDQLKNYILNAN